ncbi:F-type H+-transporting ATPase subunit delta [Virgibacillus natechei]|uniref:ATP synthase subunit delta n=1 Tax=Virgibacillus natechei TaxID=1216297 RepID=A0ABS4IHT1_9BACI|nr:F0F1 ATP synthase subunit delta [Virgibacillus natechei]MBP1969876.1 F-type H+-transporting ATPase subunit delta [Virgibacillus natechei]UZD12597.1 F0F1 ATP synthase subunit delta [Virgibacillus natechei]
MSEAVVAKRYADALFQLGEEKAILEQLHQELNIVHEVFQGNEQLFTFLKHPRINNERKKELLVEAFAGLSTDALNTIKLLVDRRRTEIIPSIIDHFVQLVNDAQGTAEATVYSVRELSEAERQQLEQTLVKRYSKNKFKLNNVVDPSIIGGIKIRIGNKIIDGSVSGKLDRIKRDIVTAN